MIAKIVDNLASTIRPALPTPKSRDLILGNAKYWGMNTLMILEDHYTERLEELLAEVKGDLGPDWKAAFVVAVRWARRNLPRINQSVIDHAEATIMACVEEGVQAEQPPLQHQQQTQQQQQQQQTQKQQQTQTRTSTTTPKRTKTMHTVSTMTDENTDWSPDTQEVREDQGKRLGLQSVLPETPKQRRSPRQRHPCVIEEDLIDLGIRSQSDQQSTQLLNDSQGNVGDRTPTLFPQRGGDVESGTSERILVPALVHAGQEQQPDLLEEEDREEEQLEEVEEGQSEEEELEEEQEEGEMDSELEGEDLEAEEVGQSEEEGDEGGKLEEGKDEDAETEGEEDESLSSSQDSSLFSVRIHPKTVHKLTEWKLTVEKKRLIIGDSNLARIPPHNQADLQIESYPGANFLHAEAFISKATTQVNVEAVILSLGINSRNQKAKETAVKQAQKVLRAARIRFPLAYVWIPVINFSNHLTEKERVELETLNAHIIKNYTYIPALPRAQFHTEADHIHWTKETAMDMLTHWLDFLNSTAH